MASKYLALKKIVPIAPTERDEAITAELAAVKDKTIAELTTLYNTARDEADLLREQTATVKARVDALEISIRDRLDVLDGDSITMNGYTWSPTYEPYPVAEDPAAIVAYFKEHGMEDQLMLKASELAARLKNFVKEEALQNELIIVEKTIPDPETGAERTVNDVRSQIPGVRVWLKPGLSRTRSSKGVK